MSTNLRFLAGKDQNSSILDRVVDDMSEVLKFIDVKHTSLVNQAFASALRTMTNNFDTQLVAIGVGPNVGHDIIVHPLSQALRACAQICPRITTERTKGQATLDIIHGELIIYDTEVRGVLSTLLTSAAQPLNVMSFDWLCYGNVTDPAGEFGIVETSTSDPLERFKARAGSDANDVTFLQAGLFLNLLRTHNHAPPDIRGALARQFRVSPSKLHLVPLVDDLCDHQNMKEATAVAHAMAREATNAAMFPASTLRSFKLMCTAILLGSRGGIIDAFVAAAKHLLLSPATSESGPRLSRLLHSIAKTKLSPMVSDTDMAQIRLVHDGRTVSSADGQHVATEGETYHHLKIKLNINGGMALLFPETVVGSAYTRLFWQQLVLRIGSYQVNDQLYSYDRLLSRQLEPANAVLYKQRAIQHQALRTTISALIEFTSNVIEAEFASADPMFIENDTDVFERRKLHEQAIQHCVRRTYALHLRAASPSEQQAKMQPATLVGHCMLRVVIATVQYTRAKVRTHQAAMTDADQKGDGYIANQLLPPTPVGGAVRDARDVSITTVSRALRQLISALRADSQVLGGSGDADVQVLRARLESAAEALPAAT